MKSTGNAPTESPEEVAVNEIVYTRIYKEELWTNFGNDIDDSLAVTQVAVDLQMSAEK
jgi:hypothetical protein